MTHNKMFLLVREPGFKRLTKIDTVAAQAGLQSGELEVYRRNILQVRQRDQAVIAANVEQAVVEVEQPLKQQTYQTRDMQAQRSYHRKRGRPRTR